MLPDFFNSLAANSLSLCCCFYPTEFQVLLIYIKKGCTAGAHRQLASIIHQRVWTKEHLIGLFQWQTNALGHVYDHKICMHKTVDKNAKPVVLQASDHTTGLQLLLKIMVLVLLSFINTWHCIILYVLQRH